MLAEAQIGKHIFPNCVKKLCLDMRRKLLLGCDSIPSLELACFGQESMRFNTLPYLVVPKKLDGQLLIASTSTEPTTLISYERTCLGIFINPIEKMRYPQTYSRQALKRPDMTKHLGFLTKLEFA